jgi:hypothetical protein
MAIFLGTPVLELDLPHHTLGDGMLGGIGDI